MEEAVAEGQVGVRWCGSYFTVDVTPGDKVEDLKRKFSGIESLPVKRQRLKVTTTDEEDLANGILLSTLPVRINLYGLNQREDDIYLKAFKEQKRDLTCHVTDKGKPLKDFDSTLLGITRGTYELGFTQMDCLLKTSDERIQVDKVSFELMSHFRHPNSVPMLNVYQSGRSLHLRLILSDSIDGTLSGYIKKQGQAAVFDSNLQTFTPFFMKILIEFCGLLEKLIAAKVCPKSLSLNNLYLKMVQDQPQLRVIFNHVEPLLNTGKGKALQLHNLCGNIKDIIYACVPQECVMNYATKRFSQFLGNEAANFFGHDLMQVAQSYPHGWTDERKGAYLIEVMSSTVDPRPAIKKSGIKWPTNPGGGILDEIDEIQKMVDEDNETKQKKKTLLKSEGRTTEANKIKIRTWNYLTIFPDHMVRMVRNFWKHYDTLPKKLKAHLGDRAGALRALERWCPGVWFLMYNAIGPTCKFCSIYLCV